MYKSRFAFDRLRVANPFCNSFVSQVQLLCHKSITRASHRQGVLRNFSGQKCKKFKNRSVQNRNTSATVSGSVPFSRYACVALRVRFPGSATHFCSFTHFSSKVRLIKNAYYCILIHLIAYCTSFAFPVHKKRHRALHFCKARCPRFDRFPVSSSLPEPSSGSVRSGPGSWCCGTRTAYRPDVQ